MGRMSNLPLLIHQAKIAIPRLEHLLPDSVYAHRASGCRRNLLRLLSTEEHDLADFDETRLQYALDVSFAILEQAAKDGRLPINSPTP